MFLFNRSEEIASDPVLAEMLLERNGTYLADFSEEIQSDPRLVEIAVRSTPMARKFSRINEEPPPSPSL